MGILGFGGKGQGVRDMAPYVAKEPSFSARGRRLPQSLRSFAMTIGGVCKEVAGATRVSRE